MIKEGYVQLLHICWMSKANRLQVFIALLAVR